MPGKPTFIDLFCGCGGFTLGMLRAGFECKAAIDFDEHAIETFTKNLPQVIHILCKDLTKFTPVELAEVLGSGSIDVIVGGPPCQGFSTARQVDGANHGARLKPDPRRHLYREFLRYVEFFKPKVFVLENVLGIRTAAGGEYFTRVQREARELGYRVHSQIEDAWELGVPQKRRRQLVIGVSNERLGYFPAALRPAPRAEPRIWLGAAIGDLPVLRAGGGENERDYDLSRRTGHIRNTGHSARDYLLKVLEINRAKKLTNHVARPHSPRDLRDFARLREGENSATALRERGVEFEFPYKRHHFKDRYTRQSRWLPCSTIVAHLSKDGLMFIHPTQNRSLTPREAARVQTFPDWFRFPEARTHAFRLVGNAVPPLIGEALGLEVARFLQIKTTRLPKHRFAFRSKSAEFRIGGDKPQSPALTRDHAVWVLERLASLDRRTLRTSPKAEFLHGWHAFHFLFPSLHPHNARDHGSTKEHWPEVQFILPWLGQDQSWRYARSGWPVALTLLGQEAIRRYDAGNISDDEFYCVTDRNIRSASKCGEVSHEIAIART